MRVWTNAIAGRAITLSFRGRHETKLLLPQTTRRDEDLGQNAKLFFGNQLHHSISQPALKEQFARFIQPNDQCWKMIATTTTGLLEELIVRGDTVTNHRSNVGNVEALLPKGHKITSIQNPMQLTTAIAKRSFNTVPYQAHAHGANHHANISISSGFQNTVAMI